MRRARRTRVSLDIEFPDAFLHTDVFDGVADLVGERELLRHGFDQDERCGRISGIELDIFDTKCARPKRLTRFQIFYPIQLESVGYLIENTFGNFQSFARKLVDLVFRLEEMRKRDEDRHDGWRENVRAKFSGRLVAPENGK